MVRTAEKSHTHYMSSCAERAERDAHAWHYGIDSGEVYASKSCDIFSIMQMRGEKYQLTDDERCGVCHKHFKISRFAFSRVSGFNDFNSDLKVYTGSLWLYYNNLYVIL